MIRWDATVNRWLAHDEHGAVIGSANDRGRARLVTALGRWGGAGRFVKCAREPASFAAELDALTALAHTEAVVRLLDHDAAAMVLVLEHCGVSLDRLPRESWPPLDRVIAALDRIHGAGWAHCDAQAKNAAIDDGGRVRWLDLEAAARFESFTDWWWTPSRACEADRQKITDFYATTSQRR